MKIVITFRNGHIDTYADINDVTFNNGVLFVDLGHSKDLVRIDIIDMEKFWIMES